MVNAYSLIAITSVVVGMLLVPVAPVSAQCPAGKAEVVIVTPSGMSKALCIPDTAVSGLEQAAEHSDGTILPSTCPCWDAEDVKTYELDKLLAYCTYVTPMLECFDYNKQVVLEAEKIVYCADSLKHEERDLKTTEQWNACHELVAHLLD